MGDHDLATQLVRLSLSSAGASLEEVTSELADRFGLGLSSCPRAMIRCGLGFIRRKER